MPLEAILHLENKDGVAAAEPVGVGGAGILLLSDVVGGVARPGVDGKSRRGAARRAEKRKEDGSWHETSPEIAKKLSRPKLLQTTAFDKSRPRVRDAAAAGAGTCSTPLRPL